MIRKPNCKINLGLYVTGKRPDGYHNLETVFLPIPLCDELEMEPAEDFSFRQEGIQLDSGTEGNLCVKAYRMLQQDFPQIGNLRIRLHKSIPFGAGLGGGSSDAAESLILIDRLFWLGLSDAQLASYAARLGSDCPFFITNRPAFATGRGELLEPLPPLDLGDYDMLLLKPDDAVSTAEAYRNITPAPAPTDLRKAVLQPVGTWRNLIHNQFEDSVFPQHPAIRACKEQLYREGALYASMTGSGSCVYGFFPKGHTPDIKGAYLIAVNMLQ